MALPFPGRFDLFMRYMDVILASLIQIVLFYSTCKILYILKRSVSIENLKNADEQNLKNADEQSVYNC